MQIRPPEGSQTCISYKFGHIVTVLASLLGNYLLNALSREHLFLERGRLYFLNALSKELLFLVLGRNYLLNALSKEILFLVLG